MPDPSPHTPSRLDDAVDRRKFLSFLVAGVVAANLPLPVGFPTEELPVIALKSDWVFTYFLTIEKGKDAGEWRIMGKQPASTWKWRTA